MTWLGMLKEALDSAVEGRGVQRMSYGGIPVYGAQKGQPKWKYSIVADERGQRHLRLSTGDKTLNWKLTPGAVKTELAAERSADLNNNGVPDHMEVIAQGSAQVHKSGPAEIQASLQDGRLGSTFRLIKGEGDRWKMHLKPGRQPVENTALQFVTALKEKTAMLKDAIEELKLEPGASFRTGPNQRALIKLPGGNTQRVGPNSFFTPKPAVPAPVNPLKPALGNPVTAGILADATPLAGTKLAMLKIALDQELRNRISRAESETNTNPSEAQCLAENYRKGKVTLHGLTIAIETPKGAPRRGTSRDGKKWETTMTASYGYIKNHESEADGDHVDIFLGDNPESEVVFVVDQVRPESGRFDEHKCIVGVTSEKEARKLYLSNYQKGWKGLGGITSLTMTQFKAWLKKGKTGRPLRGQKFNLFHKKARHEEPYNAYDLDGTLSFLPEGKGLPFIGKPIKGMMDRLKADLSAGIKVKIFTSRAHNKKNITAVRRWLRAQGLPALPVTNMKTPGLKILFDDRAVGVHRNKGTLKHAKLERLRNFYQDKEPLFATKVAVDQAMLEQRPKTQASRLQKLATCLQSSGNWNKCALGIDTLTYPLTGDSALGSAAAGAAAGAVGGAGLHYFRKLKRKLLGEPEPYEGDEPGLLASAGLGAALGGGLSLGWRGLRHLQGGYQPLQNVTRPFPGDAGPEQDITRRQMEKRSYLDKDSLISRIMSDHSLSQMEKSRLVAMVEQASRAGLPLDSDTLANAGLGALAAWVASRMGGFGLFGQSAAAVIGGGLGAYFTPQSSIQHHRGWSS